MRSEYLTSPRAIRAAIDGSAGESTLIVASETPLVVELVAEAHRHGIAVERTTRAELARVAPEARGAALRVNTTVGEAPTLRQAIESTNAADALIVVLDHITDPQNYGAILRSADQFGVALVVVPGRRAVPLTATVIQASAGTAQFARIVTVANIANALKELQAAGFWVYGADLSGQRMDRLDARGRVALVLGSEGPGLHRLVRERCDLLVRIPAAGHVDSFNVSVAAGILMFEVRRQQGFPSLR